MRQLIKIIGPICNASSKVFLQWRPAIQCAYVRTDHSPGTYVSLGHARSKVNITWLKPKKMRYFHPANTGDLSLFGKRRGSVPRLIYRECEEYITADSAVKKVFQMEFQYPYEKFLHYTQELIDRVKRHEYDNSSSEVYIAKLTARIRYLQTILKGRFKKRMHKIQIDVCIGKRLRALKILRRSDYAKFEWVLEQLQLVYKPVPLKPVLTRKQAVTLLADMQITAAREQKMAEYKRELDNEKIPFLMEKLEKLEWIQEQEKKYGLPPTVSSEDIENCKWKLDDVKRELQKIGGKLHIRTVHPYEGELYDPEALLEAELRGMEIRDKDSE